MIHQRFSLQQLSECQWQRRQRLYLYFLDLKGAFDRTSQLLLWQPLQRLGVHGCMLAALRSLYSTARVAISIQGLHDPALQCITGVKQGCPLSLTLFGLLAHGLHVP